MGLGPILPSEIEAWSRIGQIDVSPVEIDLIRQIDRQFRTYKYKKDHPDPVPISQTMRDVAEQAKARRALKEGKNK